MSENCVFCQVVARKSPAEILYQDERVTAFNDQHPAAPVHILIVPNRHIGSLNEINDQEAELLGYMVVTARRLAAQNHIEQDGYRLMINTGTAANQTVHHLHLHLLGGQRLPGLTR